MLFGGQVNMETAQEQIDMLIKNASPNKVVIDTARLYQKGETEKVIGSILQQQPHLRNQLEIHTKADPSIANLNKKGIRFQLETSLKSLNISQVEVFYLHMPDTSVSFEETFEACNELYKEGKFVELGLSNYPSWAVVAIYYLCKERGWVKPTVYQGVYHLFTRSMEYELIPTLRFLCIRLHVFSPLCGGLLTGRYRSLTEASSLVTGRFSPAYHNHHLYVERYWKPEIFKALEMLLKVAEKENISLTNLSLRWLFYHSKMRAGDGIVFGASSLVQLKEDLQSIQMGPLNNAVLKITDEIAEIVRPVEAQYFRGYDKVHGRSDRWLLEWENSSKT